MAEDSADRLSRQVHRLFSYGTIGGLSDAQLLERFLLRQDEAAEAAFEELVIRHGPMVLRVCRGILFESHDADDAFQATFIVLASRAQSIRHGSSVASWLYGVAYRVSTRVKRRATRRRGLDQRLFERTPPQDLPARTDPDWEILHEEINHLPESLRSPIVLCYLEGQTSVTAAQQLGLSEATIRGRLARARERLRRRLMQRGVSTLAVALDMPGMRSQSAATLTESLIHSTVRIALGFTSGNPAEVLARGVLSSMLLNQLKVGAAIAIVVVGSVYGVWRSSAAAIEGTFDDQPAPIGETGKVLAASPAPPPDSPAPSQRLLGIVKVEGTDQAIAGAKFRVLTENGSGSGSGSRNERVVESGADGRFEVDLKGGPTRIWLSDPPAGYLVSNVREAWENLIVTPDQAVIQRTYRVRRGTLWSFRFLGGANRGPAPGFVTAQTRLDPPETSRAQADKLGLARLTLPIDARKIPLQVSNVAPESAEIRTGFLTLGLEWEPNFQPGELEKVVPIEGKSRRFRLIDSEARSALLEAPEFVEPINDHGRLLIDVRFPSANPKDAAALTGQVVDAQGQPIAGSQVTLTTPGTPVVDEPRYKTMTDDLGRYRLSDLPTRGIDGKPLQASLLVTKEGYAAFGSPLLTINANERDQSQVVDLIRLERGVSISGIVVDHRAQPMAGVWVRSNQAGLKPGSSATFQSTQTNENGKFRIHNLNPGLVQIMALHGNSHVSRTYLADGTPDEARLKLPDPSVRGAAPTIAAVRQGSPAPVAVGHPAPDWLIGPWSDGRARNLGDERNQIVVLYFWGINFPQSVRALPALGRLATKYQTRGVDFFAIHNADLDEQHALEVGKKVLAFYGASMIMGIDQTRMAKHARGKTANEYGVNAPPVIIVIDRAGKVAFRSDIDKGGSAHNIIFKRESPNAPGMSAEKSNERIEQLLGEHLDQVLNRDD